MTEVQTIQTEKTAKNYENFIFAQNAQTITEHLLQKSAYNPNVALLKLNNHLQHNVTNNNKQQIFIAKELLENWLQFTRM